MSLNKHLLFLTDGIIPSKRAGALHVQNLLPHLRNNTKQVTLLSQSDRVSQSSEDGHFTVKIPSYKGKLILLLLRMRGQIRQIKPEIIYSRYVLLPLINRNIPYLIELHDDAWNKGLLYEMAFRFANGSNSCLGFVAITNKIKEDFKAKFPDSKKPIVVIPDAANVPSNQYAPSYISRAKLNIAYVGSFHKGKGIEVILPLAEAMPEHNFILIGESESYVDELISKGGYGNLLQKGFIAQKDIWREMIDIDICLLPNQREVLTGKKSNIGKYTSPLKMFEYMAYSKPIIASDLEVLREVLDEEIAAFAACDNVNEWISAIILLTDVGKREDLGRNANKKLIENYTWEKRAERIIHFLNE
ncbi:MAG: glycosyltransferase involved in cell wall biosynthesis [Arcticibacterium sp.]|jgi:glycosyltransferase involved in cell wall biosynthesis